MRLSFSTFFIFLFHSTDFLFLNESLVINQSRIFGKLTSHLISLQDTENIFFLYAELCTDPNYNLFKFFKGFWKNYKVGQQQDAHELLHMMMEEIQQKCFG